MQAGGRGFEPHRLHRTDSGRQSIHDALAGWSFSWRAQGYSERTLHDYEGYLASFCAEHDPLTATTSDVASWLVSRSSPSVRRMARQALVSFYRWATSEGLLDANPTRSLRRPKEPQRPTRVADRDTITALLATCRRSWLGQRDRAIILTLRASGMRRSEVARMRLADVDLAERTVVVPTSKTGKPRTTVLDGDAAQSIGGWLAVRRGDSNALWTGRTGEPLASNGVALMLRRRASEADVKVSAHDFRRAFAETWLARGGTETGLMRLAGWSSTAMCAHYSRTNGEALAVDEARRLLA